MHNSLIAQPQHHAASPSCSHGLHPIFWFEGHCYWLWKSINTWPLYKTTCFCCYCLVAKPRLILCDPMDCSLLASLSMDFSGKDTGVGCHFLLQGIFSTQISNPHISCIAGGFFTTEPPGKPSKSHTSGQMAEPQKVWSIFAFLNFLQDLSWPPLHHYSMQCLSSSRASLLSRYFLNPLTTTDFLMTDSFLGEYRSLSRTSRKPSRGTKAVGRMMTSTSSREKIQVVNMIFPPWLTHGDQVWSWRTVTWVLSKDANCQAKAKTLDHLFHLWLFFGMPKSMKAC